MRDNSALPIAFLLLASVFIQAEDMSLSYRWLRAEGSAESLRVHIELPSGYQRSELAGGSFGYWLRNLPLKPGKPPVYLFDKTMKSNQDAHYAVIDLDVGNRDLQQCADAVIRLRAEYAVRLPKEA